MPKYIIQGNTVHFRQSYPLDVLRGLFLALDMLEVKYDLTGSARYPWQAELSESEFLSVIELAKGA